MCVPAVVERGVVHGLSFAHNKAGLELPNLLLNLVRMLRYPVFVERLHRPVL